VGAVGKAEDVQGGSERGSCSAASSKDSSSPKRERNGISETSSCDSQLVPEDS